VLYSTGFEAPTFTTGALDGQGGWTGAGGAAVENTVAYGGSQAVGAGSGAGAYYAETITPNGTVVLSAMIDIDANGSKTYFDVGTSTSVYDITAGVQLDAAPNGVTVLAVSGPAPYQSVGTMSYGAWHDVSLILNYATQTFGVSIDGQSVASGLAFCGGDTNDGACLGNRVTQFGDAAFFSRSARSGDSYMDNVSIDAVPEPGAWSLMIAGAALAGGALRVRRGAARAPIPA
jgi:hypothetical protein